jgi:hypothetical protein
MSNVAMPFRQPTPVASLGKNPVILRPDPRWFLTRGLILGIGFPLLLSALGARSFGLPCVIAAGMLWLVFKSSYIALDSQGFRYHSGVRRIAHAWVDIERFAVVEQRMLAFITVSQYLGWNYSPAYKNYKLLAIPRTLARWTGTTDAMFKPIGFNVRALTAVMNEHLEQSRSTGSKRAFA